MLQLPDADTAENNPNTANAVITPVSCTMPRKPGEAPALHDLHPIRLLDGSRIRTICGTDVLYEGFFCNYEVNQDYVSRFEAAGLRITGLGPEGQARAVELRQHPFFIATLFHPQLGSKPGQPHPLLDAYIRAACGGRA